MADLRSRLMQIAAQLAAIASEFSGATRDPVESTFSAAEIFRDPYINYLTPTEIAEKFGVTPDAVRKTCRQRKLGVRHGGRWLVDPREAENYFRGRD